MNIPVKSLHGINIPVLGFGTYRMPDADVKAIVPQALDAGYRHIDTAQYYENEASIGRCLTASGIERNELFVTTKVWVSNYSEDRFLASIDESLEKLEMEQVDLLLLHWPGHDVPVTQQIDWLNIAHELGKTRLIGVSNQNSAQMKTSVLRSTAPISINQIEAHPFLDQSSLSAAADKSDVTLAAYYAMADGAVPKDPTLQKVGAKYGKSAAQITLRWLIEKDMIVLSKTVNANRLKENASVFDFHLDDEDLKLIAALTTQNRRLINPQSLAPVWDK